MADNCNRNCDPVEAEARSLSRLLDTGRNTNQVASALREDSYNMSPRDFNRLVTLMQRTERVNYGDDLYKDQVGNLIIDKGNQQLVVATRDFDMQQQQYARHGGGGHDHDRRGDRRGGYPNNGRDPVTDGVVNGAIGAGVGAIIDGKKGAIAGGIGGVGNVIVDRVGGPNNRDDVTDVVVKGAIGTGIGAIIDGKKGAIAGAAGSVVPNVLDKIFNRRD